MSYKKSLLAFIIVFWISLLIPNIALADLPSNTLRGLFFILLGAAFLPPLISIFIFFVFKKSLNVALVTIFLIFIFHFFILLTWEGKPIGQGENKEINLLYLWLPMAITFGLTIIYYGLKYPNIPESSNKTAIHS